MFRELMSSKGPVSLHSVSPSNLECIKVLIENSFKMGDTKYHNIANCATIDPSIWLPDILDKHFRKISYVCSFPRFQVFKSGYNDIIINEFNCDYLRIDNDIDLDSFFDKWVTKKLALYSIIKSIDINSITSYYTIRYCDVTDKIEERDETISNIIK